MRFKKGQSVLEYAVLIACVVTALLAMQVYLKRARQGNLKLSGNSLGQQYAPLRTSGEWHKNSTSRSRASYLTVSEWDLHEQGGYRKNFNFRGDAHVGNRKNVFATETRNRLLENEVTSHGNETVEAHGSSLFGD